MIWKIFFVTFGSIFLAELGDKTQLATIAFTANNIRYKWIVFLAAAGALILTSFLGVFFGHLLTKYISPKYIKLSAGILFMMIGLIMIIGVIKEKPSKHVKLISKIEQVYMIEKCRYCMKFNEFVKNNIDEDNIKNIRLPGAYKLHSPFNCDDCNTEHLMQIVKREI